LSSSTKPPLTSEQRQAALQLAMETHYRALFHRNPGEEGEKGFVLFEYEFVAAEFALDEMRTEKARSVRNIIGMRVSFSTRANLLHLLDDFFSCQSRIFFSFD
jgi:hypothetical protein